MFARPCNARVRRARFDWATYVAVVALVLALVAGPVLAQPGSDQIVLRHLSYPGTEEWNTYIAQRIEAFEALHPNIKIERIMPARVAEIEDTFLTWLAGGIAPDTSEVTLSVGGSFMSQGHFMDLRPFFERDPEVSTDMFAPPAVAALTWPDGQIWGIPQDMFAPLTFFNADMFAEAGLTTPAELGPAGWTWERVVESATRLTIDRNGDGMPEQWGLEDSYGVLFGYGNPVYQAGGAYFDRQAQPTRVTLLDPKTVSALEWIVSLYNEYEVIGGNTAFRAGTAALSFSNGAPSIPIMRDADINFGIATNTMGPENNGGYYAVNSVNITKYTQHPEAAWEFIKFLAADADNQRDFVSDVNRVTSHLEVLSEYASLTGNPPEFVQPVMDTITNPAAFHDPIGPGARDARLLITDTLYAQAYLERQPVRLVLDSLQPQVQALLDEAWSRAR